MKVVERANAFKYYLGACIRALRTFTRCDNDSTYIEEELKYIAPPAFYSWKKIGSRHLELNTQPTDQSYLACKRV